MVAPDQTEEIIDLAFCNVLLHKLSVVVEKMGDTVFSLKSVSDLTLHETKVLGNCLSEDGNTDTGCKIRDSMKIKRK